MARRFITEMKYRDLLQSVSASVEKLTKYFLQHTGNIFRNGIQGIQPVFTVFFPRRFSIFRRCYQKMITFACAPYFNTAKES